MDEFDAMIQRLEKCGFTAAYSERLCKQYVSRFGVKQLAAFIDMTEKIFKEEV